jgi:hypothetical protein
VAVDKPKYDFYENAIFLDDPMNADLSRKPRVKAPKIGTEPRVSHRGELRVLRDIDAVEYAGTDTGAAVSAKGQA